MTSLFEDFCFPVEDNDFDTPPRRNEEVRLLVVDAENGSIAHDYFDNLGHYLRDDDLLVFNDVGISPSRLTATTQNGNRFDLCFLLNDPADDRQWEAIILADSRPPHSGLFTALDGKITGSLEGRISDFDGGYWIQRHKFKGYRGSIRVDQHPDSIRKLLDRYGKYMHPWYADINELPEESLNPEITNKKGAVLLSEPSRRMSSEMIETFRQRGIDECFISLWMSFSWNQATPETDLAAYKMNEEEFEVGQETIEKILRTEDRKQRVISVGTSGARALESLPNPPVPTKGRTDLFIHPGIELKYCDALLTNLHNSMGTHVIMASAFANTDIIMEACRQAVEKGYYFGIHGDSTRL
jgi:S-adenosylmethionine:tRNA ribosyltransferase-isomerase